MDGEWLCGDSAKMIKMTPEEYQQLPKEDHVKELILPYAKGNP